MGTRGNHGRVKITNQKRPLLNRPSRTHRIIPKRFLDSYNFIYYSRQNMVSGQQVEFIILPLSAILTLAWDLKQSKLIKIIFFLSFSSSSSLSLQMASTITSILFQIPTQGEDG